MKTTIVIVIFGLLTFKNLESAHASETCSKTDSYLMYNESSSNDSENKIDSFQQLCLNGHEFGYYPKYQFQVKPGSTDVLLIPVDGSAPLILGQLKSPLTNHPQTLDFNLAPGLRVDFTLPKESIIKNCLDLPNVGAFWSVDSVTQVFGILRTQNRTVKILEQWMNNNISHDSAPNGCPN